jgi:hypothetical protein
VHASRLRTWPKKSLESILVSRFAHRAKKHINSFPLPHLSGHEELLPRKSARNSLELRGNPQTDALVQKPELSPRPSLSLS